MRRVTSKKELNHHSENINNNGKKEIKKLRKKMKRTE